MGKNSGSLEPCSSPRDVNKQTKWHGTLTGTFALQPLYSRPLSLKQLIFFFFFFFFKGRVGGRFFLQLSGHIPQVRIQFTVLQINKQDQQRLLALILIQNVVFDRREITWFT